jgi:predicted phosphoribosyltransferase
VILTDDGVATGATIKAAISALKKERIRELVIALPVAPPDTANELSKMADKFICLETPPDFMSVGSYYNDFEQVSDSEVVELLGEAEAGRKAKPR